MRKSKSSKPKRAISALKRMFPKAETKAIAEYNGPRNVIASMVAEQTRELRGRILQLESDRAVMSERIMYLENPNIDRSRGVGVFPRSGRSRSETSELAGRPGTLREAAAEMLNGEAAREELPTERHARTDETISGGRNVQFRELTSRVPIGIGSAREYAEDRYSGMNPPTDPRLKTL